MSGWRPCDRSPEKSPLFCGLFCGFGAYGGWTWEAHEKGSGGQTSCDQHDERKHTTPPATPLTSRCLWLRSRRPDRVTTLAGSSAERLERLQWRARNRREARRSVGSRRKVAPTPFRRRRRCLHYDAHGELGDSQWTGGGGLPGHGCRSGGGFYLSSDYQFFVSWRCVVLTKAL